MALVVLALLGGLLVGRARGGRLATLRTVPYRYGWLVVAAVLAQAVGALAPLPAAYPLGLVAAGLLAAAFLGHNRHLPGVGLLALGLLANALVVALNGAMPVSLAAASRAGVTSGRLIDDPRHEVADDRTRLALLGDVVPLPLPGVPEVLSPGDVLVAAGVGLLASRAMTGVRLPSPARPVARRRPRYSD